MKSGVISAGATAWIVGDADEVLVLVDAEAYYRSFYSAALLARGHIYIAGWQFDTKARLLRPAVEPAPSHPVELLPFLNHLCERTPSLHIHMVAWDYSLVYAIEREWLQKLKFDFQSHPRVHFVFTNHPDPGGCYHRKLIIIDDEVAFLGGLDLCDSRWDTRRHAKHAVERVDVGGQPYKAFHDIQVALRGPIVESLRKIFLDDWRRATDAAPESAIVAQPSAPAPGREPAGLPLAAAAAFSLEALSGGLGLPIGARRVALSRTECDSEGRHSVGEIQCLMELAINGAERLIYIETQYFTSRSLAETLCRRLGDGSKSKLQIVLVMPDGADSPKEDFVLGNRQRAIRHLIANFARHFGHEFRLLTSSESTPEDPASATFIHSKLLIVDDEFSTIGSANFTNRSMRVDFELNAAWEARLEDGGRAERLRADLRALRASLLAEHAGSRDAAFFEPIEDLMARIDLACQDPGGKLRNQAMPEPLTDNPLLIAIFDPSGPLDWDTIDQSIEEAFDSDEGFVKRTAQKLGQRLGVVDVDK